MGETTDRYMAQKIRRRYCKIAFACYYADTCVLKCELDATRELRTYEHIEPIDFNACDPHLKGARRREFQGLGDRDLDTYPYQRERRVN